MEQILLISSLALWILVVLNLLLTLGLARRINTRTQREPFRGGEQAPNFTVPTLQGQTLRLADFAGRAFVFIFFSPDCSACSEIFGGIKQLKTTAQEVGAELLLVGDHEANSLSTYTQNLDLDNLPVLVAPRLQNSLLTDYKILGVPWHCIIDEHGKIFSADFASVGDIVQGLSRLQRKEDLIERDR